MDDPTVREDVIQGSAQFGNHGSAVGRPEADRQPRPARVRPLS